MTELLSKFREKIKNMTINDTTIMTMLKIAMEIVETSSLKGAEQKKAALSLLTTIINESPLNAERKTIYLKMVESGAVNVAVDIIVDASKGNLKINENYKKVVGFAETLRNLFKCLR